MEKMNIVFKKKVKRISIKINFFFKNNFKIL
jgi:hypothetical protein